jgi:hypothetical protein
MILIFAPFLIAGVHHRRRFAHRVNLQHRRNSCSDIRKVRWTWCPSALRRKQRGCYSLGCLELQKRRNDFEWLRAEWTAASRDVPLAASKAERAAPRAVWTASPRAVVWTADLMVGSRAASKASPLHCYSSNCSQC